MGKTTPLKHQQQQRHHLALLAVLADRSTAKGNCLADETLAALVEGKLNQDETDFCMEHLAGCDRCYTLWCRLDVHWHAHHTTSKITQLYQFCSRPKILTTAGSLLGIAASIAVFLQLTMQSGTDSLPPAQHSLSETEQVLAPVLPKIELQQQSPPGLQASPSVSDSLQGKQAALPAPSTRHIPKMEKRSSPSLNQPRTHQDSALSVSAVHSLAQWQHLIRQGCSQPPDPSFFQQILDTGQVLLQPGATATLSPPERQQVKRILEQLRSTSDQTFAQRCARIVSLTPPFQQH